MEAFSLTSYLHSLRAPVSLSYLNHPSIQYSVNFLISQSEVSVTNSELKVIGEAFIEASSNACQSGKRHPSARC